MWRRIITILCTLFMVYQLAGCQVVTARQDKMEVCMNGASPTLISQHFQFPGTLLIYDSTRSLIIGYDGETQEFTTLMDLTGFEDYHITSLSQNGRWLLVSQYQPSDPRTMELFALYHTGQIEHKQFPLPESDDQTLRYYQWVNGQALWGRIDLDESANYGIFEPLIPQWQPLDFSSLDFQDDTGITLSPDLSRILYINSQWSLVLQDLPGNQSLWEDSDYEAITPVYSSPVLYPAIWSVDGSLLAVPASHSLDQEMEFEILVLDQFGNSVSSARLDDRPDGLNFSHNQKYLAFYGERKTSEHLPVIRLMEIASGEITDLCNLGSGTDPVMKVQTKTIHWSFDDAYIAYNYGDAPPAKNNENKNGIIIQKLDQEQIWLIPSGERNFNLLGWSPYRWTSSIQAQ